MSKVNNLDWQDGETHEQYLKRLDAMESEAEREFIESKKRLRKERAELLENTQKKKQILEAKRERIIGRAVMERAKEGNIKRIEEYISEKDRIIVCDILEKLRVKPNQHESIERTAINNFPRPN